MHARPLLCLHLYARLHAALAVQHQLAPAPPIYTVSATPALPLHRPPGTGLPLPSTWRAGRPQSGCGAPQTPGARQSAAAPPQQSTCPAHRTGRWAPLGAAQLATAARRQRHLQRGYTRCCCCTAVQVKMERAGATLSGEASSLRESVSWARVWSLPSLAITYSTLTMLRTCAGTWVREGGSVRAEQQRDTANIEPCDPYQGLPDANKAGCLQACTEAGRTRFRLTGLSRKNLGQATADLETRTEQLARSIDTHVHGSAGRMARPPRSACQGGGRLSLVEVRKRSCPSLRYTTLSPACSGQAEGSRRRRSVSRCGRCWAAKRRVS